MCTFAIVLLDSVGQGKVREGGGGQSFFKPGLLTSSPDFAIFMISNLLFIIFECANRASWSVELNRIDANDALQ